jgi:hypothetical protein
MDGHGNLSHSKKLRRDRKKQSKKLEVPGRVTRIRIKYGASRKRPKPLVFLKL